MRRAIQGNVNWDKVWNKELNPSDVQYYLNTFRKGGMTGPLNYYRTTKLRFEEESAINSVTILPKIPWLLIYGEKDKTCNSRLVHNTRKFVPQVKVVKLEGKSHWVMIEAKEEVARLVLDFVNELVGQKARL